MTEDIGHMTNEVSREVRGMLEEIINGELSNLDMSKEFTVMMYSQILDEKGIQISYRTATNRLNALVNAGKLKMRRAIHNGRQCWAFSKADNE